MENEKKKKLQGWQKILILLVVLLVVIGIYAGLNKYNDMKAEEEAASVEILSVKASKVLSFTYELDGVVYTFERENAKSDWVYQQDPSAELDQDSVTDMLSRAVSVSTEQVVAESMDDAADYGLDQPVLTITMTLKDGSQKTILVGEQNSMTSDYYAAVQEDGRVFTVTTDFYSTFTTIDNLVTSDSSEDSSASAY